MTFATSVKILKEDKALWWHFTKGKNPLDFFAFQILTQQIVRFMGRSKKDYFMLLRLKWTFKKRKVITPIPGLATHIEIPWLSPLTVWHDFKSWKDLI